MYMLVFEDDYKKMDQVKYGSPPKECPEVIFYF